MASQPRHVVNRDNGRKPLQGLFILTSAKGRANKKWYIITVNLRLTAVCLSTVWSKPP